MPPKVKHAAAATASNMKKEGGGGGEPNVGSVVFRLADIPPRVCLVVRQVSAVPPRGEDGGDGAPSSRRRRKDSTEIALGAVGKRKQDSSFSKDGIKLVLADAQHPQGATFEAFPSEVRPAIPLPTTDAERGALKLSIEDIKLAEKTEKVFEEDRHYATCSVCKGVGLLMLCDGCMHVMHEACSIPSGMGLQPVQFERAPGPVGAGGPSPTTATTTGRKKRRGEDTNNSSTVTMTSRGVKGYINIMAQDSFYCYACRQQLSPADHLASLQRALSELVSTLEEQDSVLFQHLFARPVFLEFINYQYADVITAPMDLGLIRLKLNKHCYNGVAALYRDVRLMVANCLLFAETTQDMTVVDAARKFEANSIVLFEQKQNELLESGVLLQVPSALMRLCSGQSPAQDYATLPRPMFYPQFRDRGVKVLLSPIRMTMVVPGYCLPGDQEECPFELTFRTQCTEASQPTTGKGATESTPASTLGWTPIQRYAGPILVKAFDVVTELEVALQEKKRGPAGLGTSTSSGVSKRQQVVSETYCVCSEVSLNSTQQQQLGENSSSSSLPQLGALHAASMEGKEVAATSHLPSAAAVAAVEGRGNGDEEEHRAIEELVTTPLQTDANVEPSASGAPLPPPLPPPPMPSRVALFERRVTSCGELTPGQRRAYRLFTATCLEVAKEQEGKTEASSIDATEEQGKLSGGKGGEDASGEGEKQENRFWNSVRQKMMFGPAHGGRAPYLAEEGDWHRLYSDFHCFLEINGWGGSTLSPACRLGN